MIVRLFGCSIVLWTYYTYDCIHCARQTASFFKPNVLIACQNISVFLPEFVMPE